MLVEQQEGFLVAHQLQSSNKKSLDLVSQLSNSWRLEQGAQSEVNSESVGYPYNNLCAH